MTNGVAYPGVVTEHIDQEATCNHQLHLLKNATPTRNLRSCLDKARCLAAILNHPQLDTFHLMVVMALDPCGRRALLQNGVDPETAHASSLDALRRIQSTCPGLPQEKIGETHDLLNVWRGAEKIVAQRDEHQEVSIDDFMKALVSEGSSSLAVMQQVETPRALERALTAIEAALASFDRRSNEATTSEHRLARIEEALARVESHLSKPGPEPASILRPFARAAAIAVLTVGAAFVVYFSH
jgi:ATP-dependent Clp protease ATP-binding subunit ClpA